MIIEIIFLDLFLLQACCLADGRDQADFLGNNANILIGYMTGPRICTREWEA